MMDIDTDEPPSHDGDGEVAHHVDAAADGQPHRQDDAAALSAANPAGTTAPVAGITGASEAATGSGSESKSPRPGSEPAVTSDARKTRPGGSRSRETWGAGGFDQDSVVGTVTDFPLAADPTPDSRSERWGSSGASVLDPESYEENGRTYQGYKENRYFLPNDGEEQDRLDFQHAMITILLDGKLGWAPVVDQGPTRVLDLATGTGVWAIEFAELHPDCEVIGTDLTLIQPKADQLPPNCTFIKEDAEEEVWTFPEAHFDYIHLRLGFSAFMDAPKLLRNIFKHLQPGGWAEFQEAVIEFSSFDGTSQGTALERWSRAFVAGLATLGRDAHQAIRFKALLRTVGFVDVDERVLPCPCNHWPWERKWKEVGRYEAKNASKFVGSASSKVLMSSGMTAAECHQLADDARREIADTSIHGYWPFYVIVGRRPLEEEEEEEERQAVSGLPDDEMEVEDEL